MVKRELYDILGVSPEATAEEIKKAFRSLAKKCHPDHHPDDAEKEAEFKRISAAYAVLGDPEPRRHYDETGDIPGQKGDLMSEVYGLIVQVFGMVRQRHGDQIFFNNPIDLMKEILSKSIAEAQGSVNNLRDKIARNEKISGKISHKDGKGSFLHTVLTAENRKNQEQISDIERQIGIMQKAGELLKEYSFAVEKRAAEVNDKRSMPFWIPPDMDFAEFSQRFKDHPPFGFKW